MKKKLLYSFMGAFFCELYGKRGINNFFLIAIDINSEMLLLSI